MIKRTKIYKLTPAQKIARKLLNNNDKRYILLYGGSRSGKTFLLIRAIIIRAWHNPGSRHIILRHTFSEIKSAIIFDTFPKVMELELPGIKYNLNRTDFFVTLPNGSEIWFDGAEDKERIDKILGREYSTIFFNEISNLPYVGVSTVLTRLSQNTGLINKAYFDCNPPSMKHWAYQLFIKGIDPVSNVKIDTSMYAHMLMNPVDNQENLPADYITNILSKLPAKQRTRFMLGQWGSDSEKALWKQEWIDANRCSKPDAFQRVIVAVDPSGNNAETSLSNECGIVVVGEIRNIKTNKTHYYVLEDASQKGSPQAWAVTVALCYSRWNASAIIAESNFGGEMCRSVIHAVNSNLPVKLVRASKGKIARAEPVSYLYESNQVHHCGMFTELENELVTFEGEKDWSPNRLDALVWGILHMSENGFGNVVQSWARPAIKDELGFIWGDKSWR